MEPTPAEVAAVQATLPPAPQPTPAAPVQEPPVQQQPEPAQPPVVPNQAPAEPAPQPQAPAEPSDPFASLFADSAPVEPAAPQQPSQQPVEPQPTPQPANQPVEPAQPAAAPAQPEQPQTYEEYMEGVLKGVPKPPEMPDPGKINPDSPEDIKGFFDNLMATAEARVEAKIERKSAIQTAETKAWNEAFVAYPTLKSNKKVRDMVHNIRMGYFQRGIAITPAQAAKELVDSLSNSYKQGVADNTVTTTIESVQPQGGSSTPTPTTLERQDVLVAVQDGGEEALAAILDNEIQNNRL